MKSWPLVQGSLLDFVRKRVRVGKKGEGECDCFERTIHNHYCDNSFNIKGGKTAEINIFDIRNRVLR
jgi:hypothetical protein